MMTLSMSHQHKWTDSVVYMYMQRQLDASQPWGQASESSKFNTAEPALSHTYEKA